MKRIHITFDENDLLALDKYCKDERYTRSEIVGMLVKDFVKRIAKSNYCDHGSKLGLCKYGCE